MNASVSVPDSVLPGDALLLFVTTNTGLSPEEDPVGWTRVDEVADGTALTSLYSRVSEAGDAGQQVTVEFSSYSKTDMTLLAYSGTDPTDPVAAWGGVAESDVTAEHVSPSLEVPSDTSWVVSYWVAKSSTMTDWTLPTGQTERLLQVGSGGGHLTSVAADTAAPVGQGTWPGVTATGDVAAGAVTMWSVALRAG